MSYYKGCVFCGETKFEQDEQWADPCCKECAEKRKKAYEGFSAVYSLFKAYGNDCPRGGCE